MSTLVLAPFSDGGLARLAALGRVVHEPWTETRTLWDPEELGARLTTEGFDALAVEADFLFEELFDTAPGLRIAAICRGDLHHADLDAATERGIAVVRTPARNAQAVAEFAVAQMLALARHTSAGERYVREGQWEDPVDPYVRFRGRELAGATLGIIGFGAIGRIVARIARRVRDACHRLRPIRERVRQSGRGRGRRDDRPRSAAGRVGLRVDARAGYVRDDGHAGRGPHRGDEARRLPRERHQLVGGGPGGAGGGARFEGRLAGAALDVHEAHPIPPDSPFIGMPNVLLTPHIGGATWETIERHSAMVAEDFERFARGEQPSAAR